MSERNTRGGRVKPAAFEYHAPRSVEEALATLAEFGDEAKVLAGGQSLVPVMAMRLARPEHIVDINRIAELAGIAYSDGMLRLGALTRHRVLEMDGIVREAAPLLARAAPYIGHSQIRNRGTLGGSLSHADSAAELPAVAVALDAAFEIRSVRGSRRSRAGDFFLSTFMTALEPDELVTAVDLPVWDRGSGFAVAETARRHGDFALAGAVCGVQVHAGRIARRRRPYRHGQRAGSATLARGGPPRYRSRFHRRGRPGRFAGSRGRRPARSSVGCSLLRR